MTQVLRQLNLPRICGRVYVPIGMGCGIRLPIVEYPEIVAKNLSYSLGI